MNEYIYAYTHIYIQVDAGRPEKAVTRLDFILLCNIKSSSWPVHVCLQYPELLVASYNNNEEAPHEPDGVALVWNMKYKKTTPEYVFHCQVHTHTCLQSATTDSMYTHLLKAILHNMNVIYKHLHTGLRSHGWAAAGFPSILSSSLYLCLLSFPCTLWFHSTGIQTHTHTPYTCDTLKE